MTSRPQPHRAPPVATAPDVHDDAGAEPGAALPDVVVGIDGTSASVDALRQGARFAESLRLPLVAITATGGAIASAEDAEAVLAGAAHQVFAGRPPAWFRTAVREGTPAEVLGLASEHARMLVIGHRGTGTPTTSRESVSAAIALRSVCPVVIVHATHASDPESFADDGFDAVPTAPDRWTAVPAAM